MILVTGGASFIGGNFILDWLAHSNEPVINLDKLTYAGTLDMPASRKDDPRHQFLCTDISDHELAPPQSACFRYAIDTTKGEQELDWNPTETFYSRICMIMQWPLDNQGWENNVTTGACHGRNTQQYGVPA